MCQGDWGCLKDISGTQCLLCYRRRFSQGWWDRNVFDLWRQISCEYNSSKSQSVLILATQDENFQEKHVGPGLLSMVGSLSISSSTTSSIYLYSGQLWTKHERFSGTVRFPLQINLCSHYSSSSSLLPNAIFWMENMLFLEGSSMEC